jgi:predicted amidophosphoribosyltransferase
MTILDLFCPLNEKELILSAQKGYWKDGKDSFLPRIWVALDYNNPVVSKTILAAKTGQWALSTIIINWLYAQIQFGDFDFDSKTLITCVPADPDRELIRGYHLPRLLAQKISSKLDLDFLEILRKPQTTQAQGSLNREQRLINLADKFELEEDIDLSECQNLIIIDDLTTTSSTLSECAKTILRTHPNMKIIAIAVASN